MGALVTFLRSPLGKWAVIGAALLAWTVYQREQAASKARESCQSEQLQKTVDEVIRQRDVIQKALDEARTQADTTAAELKQLEKDLEQIDQTSTDGCAIPAATIERLRNIQ